MENIKKALEELEKAVENTEAVARISVTITLKKPNKSKDKESK